MSSPIFAQIQVGGEFSPEQWDELREALGLDLDGDAGDYTLDPVESAPGHWFFDYWNAYANYGDFPAAEAWLKAHGFPYDKQYEGCGSEWPAGQEQYRPGREASSHSMVGQETALSCNQVKALIASTKTRPQLIKALLVELGEAVPHSHPWCSPSTPTNDGTSSRQRSGRWNSGRPRQKSARSTSWWYVWRSRRRKQAREHDHH